MSVAERIELSRDGVVRWRAPQLGEDTPLQIVRITTAC